MLNRRDAMLRLGQMGLGALTLPNLLGAEAAASSGSKKLKGKTKSCIFIFLWGGPPQQDLWDLKPESPDNLTSRF